MSCLTNITTFGKTREGFGTQIISGCHSPSFSYTLLKYVFSLRGAMVQIPLRTTVTLVANPEARRAHRTKPAYHLSSNGQLNAGRSAGRAVGRTGGRTDGRTDGRMDGQNLKKVLFWKKKCFLAGRVRDGRLFPYFGRFFPYFRTGRPGAPRQKSTFRKKNTHPSSVSWPWQGVSRSMSSRLPLGPCTWEDMLPLRWNSHQAARKQIAHYLIHESISPWVIFRKILVHSDDVSVAAIIFLGEDIAPLSPKNLRIISTNNYPNRKQTISRL